MRKRYSRRGCSGARFHVGRSNPVVEFRFAANSFPTKRIDRHICHDSIEPGIERRLTLEPVYRSPGFQKTFLSEIPSVLLILDHAVYHHKNFTAVTDDQIVEGA